jgi:PAS domain S-box-containing protein
LTCPVVFLSDQENSYEAVESIRSGVADYIVKSQEAIEAIPTTVRRVLRDWETTTVRRRGEQIKTRLTNTMLAAPEFLGIADKKGRLLFVNRAGCRMLGIDEFENVRGKKVHHLFPDWKVGTLVHDRTSRALTNLEWTATRMKRPDGQVLDTVAAVLAHVGGGAEIEYFSILARDVSDHRKMAERIDNLEAQLERFHNLETTGQSALLMAQHFNNTLSTIASYGERALHDETGEQAARGGLEGVLDLVEHARVVIEELLRLASHEDALPTLTEIAPLVRKSINLAKLSAPPNVEVHKSIEGDGSMVVAPAHLSHIILDLCLSAFQPMRITGGRLEAKLRRIRGSIDAESGHALAGRGELLHLMIRTRPGIPASALEQTLHAMPAPALEQSGAGFPPRLSQARRIARGYDGDITVESDAASTAFHLYLPVSSAPSAD